VQNLTTSTLRSIAETPPCDRFVVTPQDSLCRRCGSYGPHVAGPGAGPHYARLVCRGCGAFLRWLPKPREGAV
jgi:hypothetical protein